MTRTTGAPERERADQVRHELDRAGVSRTAVAFYAGISAVTLWRWITQGMTEGQYLRSLDAVGKARQTQAE